MKSKVIPKLEEYECYGFWSSIFFSGVYSYVPDVEAEVVKRGIDCFSAELLHPEVA